MEAIQKPPDSQGLRLASVRAILKEIVLGSVKVKAHVVSADEREGGLRNLLNFGHSIGHAFEGILSPQILHGECVSIGMVLEASLARYLGILKGSAITRLTKCLTSFGLPVSYKDKAVQERSGSKLCRVDELFAMMGVDKKNFGRTKRVVLLSGIGRTYEPRATPVSDADIKVILSAAIEVQPTSIEEKERTCTPPGSKSISNRALLLAALGKGDCRIRNLLHSDDTVVMLDALTELQCASFEWEEDGDVLVVRGNGGQMRASAKELYLGNAGTASRFLTTVATLVQPSQLDASILTGNKRMKLRPIGPLVDSLRGNGAEIKYVEKEGSLPIRVKASRGFEGGEIELAATVSSQYVSSILMCAPYAKRPVTLRLVGGKPVSQPYIDMTTEMMRSFGIQVRRGSKSESNTYYIQQGIYRNPRKYLVESDASSATYPLAVAAITGTTCTVPNIGSSSLQGDARFAVEVLRPMGCKVDQSKTSTTVTGPKRGSLKPLKEVDMEPMTDAFLTAAVLGAVAQGPGSGNTTRIVGVANQRVKECNRIKAMKDELAKFGVECRELKDGIEVDGIECSKLRQPTNGVDCYDDHRVAMSFSVLAMAAPKPTLISERECVGKTWPSWWDELKRTFGVELDGFDMDAQLYDTKKPTHVRKSLFIIGMRGAGKSTAGNWTAKILGWPFVDLDTQLESDEGCTIPEMIEAEGWEGFRSKEVALLQRALIEKSTEHVFACGGGIVETPEARDLLTKYHQNGGLVLFVHRSVKDILEYLHTDKTRPAYSDDIKSVWLRREPWFTQCSNFEYFSRTTGTGSLIGPWKDYMRLVTSMMGRVRSLETIRTKPNSFFVTLTGSDVSKYLDLLPQVIVGSDAVELRVDLLIDPDDPENLPSAEYVGQQLAMVRGVLDLPLIFTLRSQSQGGRFPDENLEYAMQMYRLALRMGVEFLDVEINFPEAKLTSIVQCKGQTKIIASHHDPKQQLCWDDGSWVSIYNKALKYGDIVKLIGIATSQRDNRELLQFRSWAEEAHETPIIAMNMGTEGQLSRIQNTFLTPVTHPKLAVAGAPGQLSAAQIRQALVWHGVIKPEKFFLFGKPISSSRSPALHNTIFASTGLPHTYVLCETDDVKEIVETLKRADFGGASVTIPLKLDIMPYLDEVSEDVSMIGAVNTIVVDKKRLNKDGIGFHRTGYNTDWRGMTLILSHAGAKSIPDQSGLVIGGGGTSRAAIYALHSMKYSPLYIVGRSPEKIKTVIESFPSEYNLVPVLSVEEAEGVEMRPTVAIGAIPADGAMDHTMRECIEALLQEPSDGIESILLDMAYKPHDTELIELARDSNWTTVSGFQVLAAQGLYQFHLWTGITPTFDDVQAAVNRG